jgi:predicted transposase/invertase (TIGR01784 family)
LIIAITKRNEDITMAQAKSKGFSKNLEAKLQRIQDKRARMDYLSQLAQAKKAGEEKGLQKGMQEGLLEGKLEAKLEHAQKMLALGYTESQIEQITGLAPSEIEKLKELKK